jgi:hypothetical protein
MLKQILLHFLAQIDSENIPKNALRVVGKLEKHVRNYPNSKISIAYCEALEELDTVEEFEEDPESFWAEAA